MHSAALLEMGILLWGITNIEKKEYAVPLTIVGQFKT